MAKKVAPMDLDPVHSGVKEREGYSTAAPHDAQPPASDEQEEVKSIETVEGEAQTPDEKAVEMTIIEAQEAAAKDDFWQRAKAIYAALESEYAAYIFVRPVQASHSKRIEPHTYVAGVENPNGLLTPETVQTYLDQHDAAVKVTNLVGFTARDENDQPFTGAEVYFQLS